MYFEVSTIESEICFLINRFEELSSSSYK